MSVYFPVKGKQNEQEMNSSHFVVCNSLYIYDIYFISTNGQEYWQAIVNLISSISYPVVNIAQSLSICLFVYDKKQDNKQNTVDKTFFYQTLGWS